MKKRQIGAFWALLPVLIGFYFPVISMMIHDGLFEAVAGEFGGSSSSQSVILTTVRIATMSAVLATLVGLLDAVLLAGTRGPARVLIAGMLLATFLIPPAALASAVQGVIGSSTLRATIRDELGAVCMLAFRWAPVACAMLLGAAVLWPVQQERALRGLSPRLALFVRARCLMPQALRCVGLLVLLLISAAELPSYAGVETISQRVHARLTVGDAAEGWQLALGMLVAVAPVLLFLVWKLPRSDRSQWGGTVTGLPRLRGVDLLLVIRSIPVLALVFILAVTAWPRASEMAVAGSEFIDGVVGIFQELPRAFIASSIAVICGWRLADGGHRWGLLLLCLPTVLPSSLGALALLHVVRPTLPLVLDDLPILLTLAQTCKLGAVGAAAGLVASRVIPLSESNSSRLLAPVTGRWRVRFPRALPVLLPAVVIGVALVMGEVEATLLMAPPGHPSPALELHQLLHFRNDEQAARIALLLALVGSMLAAIVVAPLRRKDK